MTETLIDDIEDFSYVSYAVMSVLSIKGKALSKSAIMRECIERYGDLIEHGPYLYGEYSDDVDESIGILLSDGILQRQTPHGVPISLTEYGKQLFDAFMHTPIEDEDLIAIKEAILDEVWA